MGGAGAAEAAVAKRAFIGEFEKRCELVDNAVAQTRYNFEKLKRVARENVDFVQVGAKSRPLGSFFDSWGAFEEATKGMNYAHLPSFMEPHMEPRVMEPEARFVQVKAATGRSTGF